MFSLYPKITLLYLEAHDTLHIVNFFVNYFLAEIKKLTCSAFKFSVLGFSLMVNYIKKRIFKK